MGDGGGRRFGFFFNGHGSTSERDAWNSVSLVLVFGRMAELRIREASKGGKAWGEKAQSQPGQSTHMQFLNSNRPR
jgi:hypothetical protein